MITRDLRRAFLFFLEHAGYATPPGRAQCALNLARAELWLKHKSDLEVIVDNDTETAYCYCGDPKCKYHEGSKHEWLSLVVAIVRPCEEHGIECKHTEWLESVGGVMVDHDSDPYIRVLTAELASEILAREGK